MNLIAAIVIAAALNSAETSAPASGVDGGVPVGVATIVPDDPLEDAEGVPSTNPTSTTPPTGSPDEAGRRPILYNWVPRGTPLEPLRAMSADRYVIVYEDVLPARDRAIGVSNAQVVTRHLETVLPPNFNGWGMLDFENRFMRNLALPPTDPDHVRTVESLIATFGSIRARWPESRWTMWGVPEIPYWLHERGTESRNWADDDAERQSEVETRIVESHRRLVARLDWLNPWIYDMYSREAAAGAAWRSRSIQAQIGWARSKVRVARALSNGRSEGPIPVIPVFCPTFAPGGEAKRPSFVPFEEFREEALLPAIAEGVDGLSIWSSLGFQIDSAFRDAVNDHQREIREAGRTYLRELFENEGVSIPSFEDPTARGWFESRCRTRILRQLDLMRAALEDRGPVDGNR